MDSKLINTSNNISYLQTQFKRNYSCSNKREEFASFLLTQELLSISSVPWEDVDRVSSVSPLKLVFLGLPLRLFFLVFGDEGSSSCSLKLSSKSAAQKEIKALHGSALTISTRSMRAARSGSSASHQHEMGPGNAEDWSGAY